MSCGRAGREWEPELELAWLLRLGGRQMCEPRSSSGIRAEQEEQVILPRSPPMLREATMDMVE